MVVVAEAHDVAVSAPWYAAGRAMALHRYFDAGFVDQFRADIAAAPQDNPALFDWQNQDRLQPSDGAVLKLRRPLHRTFHVAAWEAACAIPNAVMGRPALDPAKIASAGFVIRRGDPLKPEGFLLAGGKPTGWGAVETGVDPDATRQIRALGLVPAAARPNPGYTGEEVFPLHKHLVDGASGKHSVLFGFLPIGGAEYVPPNPATPGDAQLQEDLIWPFGLAGRSVPPQVYTADAQITGGSIRSPMAALLRVLLGRYGLANGTGWADPANATLLGLLDGLAFFADPPPALAGQDLRDWAAANPAPATLGAVLRDGPTAAALFASLSSAAAAASLALPGGAPVPAGTANLLVTEPVAAQFRAALRLRLAQALATNATDMPLPKLAAGAAGRYFLVPFVRTVCPNGCPRIAWGPPSEPFAVAALFDPDAARPSLIELPSLADAGRGLGRGVSLDLPGDLADLMAGLNSGSAVQSMAGGTPPAKGLGIGFICSFSIPAITICATILLSIMLSLLNLTLGWMAWVKLCLPAPRK